MIFADDEDEDERLGYGADHSDPSQYCRHGTWIGSWWGPDYLCPLCEGGDDDDDTHAGDETYPDPR